MPDWYRYPNPHDTALPLSSPAAAVRHRMPSSARDDEQPRRRRKEYDRDREKDGGTAAGAVPRDKHRSSHKSSSSLDVSGKKIPSMRRPRSESEERERLKDKENEGLKSGTKSERGSRKVTMDVPEIAASDVRPKSAYPTFSKAHSREAVRSREDVGKQQAGSTSPEPDMATEKEKRRRSEPSNHRPPPSPPLTAEEPDIRRSGSGNSMRSAADRARGDVRTGRRTPDSESRRSVKPVSSGASLRKDARFQESEIASMPGAFPDDGSHKSTPTSSYRRTVSTDSQPASNLTQNTEQTLDSDATSVAPERKTGRTPAPAPVERSPPSVTDSQPKTPTPSEPQYPIAHTPIIDVGGSYESMQSMESGKTPTGYGMAPPPPPPPPMAAPPQVPRVDYLLKNGGLQHMIPKKLVSSDSPKPVPQYSMYQSPAIYQAAPLEEYQRVFTPLYKRLDDFIHVFRRNGSIAVATGYRSVARRLLDKLTHIFARDISSVHCDCVVCKTIPQPYLSEEEDTGVSWGEILEFVSGRRELPQWPPFSISPDDGGLGIYGATEAPMQKIDIDVPDEYRDHYKRQNQKTKLAVQSWLSQQPEFTAGPPEEADEDTLMFAMMTKLNVHQRNLFIALMHGQTSVSDSRAPTPAERPASSSTALKRTRKALQRLYRLERPPRDCECAMYLLNNPDLHGMLATLAEVNEQEWEILISGRFDGFLWSGAENNGGGLPPSASNYGGPISRGPSRQSNTPFSRNTTPFSGLSGLAPSRGTTPFSPLRNVMSPDNSIPPPPAPFPSRGPTPGPMGGGLSSPAPVQLDEDTEIAVLAELERNLYTDMERLEDAFEALHSRAELVRQLLRERSAGLSMQATLRRGSMDPGVRLGTPASGFTDFEDEDDDGLGDTASLAPDDSASQISFNRRVRKRKERRTPAPAAVVEESEEEVNLGVWEKGRRSVGLGKR
nr:hypothetical protein B0A51_07167 [Rachicladosporium sp. CCFEE 5018]